MTTYTLCNSSSSSEEEPGEVKANSAKPTNAAIQPQYVCTLDNYYGHKFVGTNTRIRMSDLSYGNVHQPNYVYNRLKKTAPYNFVINYIRGVNNPLPESTFHSDVHPDACNLKMVQCERNVEVVSNIPHFSTQRTDPYMNMVEKVLNIKSTPKGSTLFAESENEEGESAKSVRIILIRDSIIGNIFKHSVLLSVTESDNVVKIIFKGVIYEEICFDCAVRYYGEECLSQASKSYEMKVFNSENTWLVTFSTHLFSNGEKELRLFKGVDSPKNCDVLVEKSGVKIIDGYDDDVTDAISLVLGIKVEEGNYILREDGKLYKIDGIGEPQKVSGIVYNGECSLAHERQLVR